MKKVAQKRDMTMTNAPQFAIQLKKMKSGFAFALDAEGNPNLDQYQSVLEAAGFKRSTRGVYYTVAGLAGGELVIPESVASLLSESQMIQARALAPWVVMPENMGIRFSARTRDNGKTFALVASAATDAARQALMYCGFSQTPNGHLYLGDGAGDGSNKAKAFDDYDKLLAKLYDVARMTSSALGVVPDDVIKFGLAQKAAVVGSAPLVELVENFTIPALASVPVNAPVAGVESQVIEAPAVVSDVAPVAAEAVVEAPVDAPKASVAPAAAVEPTHGVAALESALKEYFGADMGSYAAYYRSLKGVRMIATFDNGSLKTLESLQVEDGSANSITKITIDSGRVTQAVAYIEATGSIVASTGKDAEKEWNILLAQITNNPNPQFYLYKDSVGNREQLAQWMAAREGNPSLAIEPIVAEKIAEEVIKSESITTPEAAIVVQEPVSVRGVNALGETVYENLVIESNADEEDDFVYEAKRGFLGTIERMRFLVLDNEAGVVSALPVLVSALLKTAAPITEALVKETAAQLVGSSSISNSEAFNKAIDMAYGVLTNSDARAVIESVITDGDEYEFFADLYQKVDAAASIVAKAVVSALSADNKEPEHAKLVEAVGPVEVIKLEQESAEPVAVNAGISIDGANTTIHSVSKIIDIYVDERRADVRAGVSTEELNKNKLLAHIMSGNALNGEEVSLYPILSAFLEKENSRGAYPFPATISEKLLADLANQSMIAAEVSGEIEAAQVAFDIQNQPNDLKAVDAVMAVVDEATELVAVSEAIETPAEEQMVQAEPEQVALETPELPAEETNNESTESVTPSATSYELIEFGVEREGEDYSYNKLPEEVLSGLKAGTFREIGAAFYSGGTYSVGLFADKYIALVTPNGKNLLLGRNYEGDIVYKMGEGGRAYATRGVLIQQKALINMSRSGIGVELQPLEPEMMLSAPLRNNGEIVFRLQEEYAHLKDALKARKYDEFTINNASEKLAIGVVPEVSEDFKEIANLIAEKTVKPLLDKRADFAQFIRVKGEHSDSLINIFTRELVDESTIQNPTLIVNDRPAKGHDNGLFGHPLDVFDLKRLGITNITDVQAESSGIKKDQLQVIGSAKVNGKKVDVMVPNIDALSMAVSEYENNPDGDSTAVMSAILPYYRNLHIRNDDGMLLVGKSKDGGYIYEDNNGYRVIESTDGVIREKDSSVEIIGASKSLKFVFGEDNKRPAVIDVQSKINIGDIKDLTIPFLPENMLQVASDVYLTLNAGAATGDLANVFYDACADHNGFEDRVEEDDYSPLMFIRKSTKAQVLAKAEEKLKSLQQKDNVVSEVSVEQEIATVTPESKTDEPIEVVSVDQLVEPEKQVKDVALTQNAKDIAAAIINPEAKGYWTLAKQVQVKLLDALNDGSVDVPMYVAMADARTKSVILKHLLTHDVPMSGMNNENYKAIIANHKYSVINDELVNGLAITAPVLDVRNLPLKNGVVVASVYESDKIVAPAGIRDEFEAHSLRQAPVYVPKRTVVIAKVVLGGGETVSVSVLADGLDEIISNLRETYSEQASANIAESMQGSLYFMGENGVLVGKTKDGHYVYQDHNGLLSAKINGELVSEKSDAIYVPRGMSKASAHILPKGRMIEVTSFFDPEVEVVSVSTSKPQEHNYPWVQSAYLSAMKRKRHETIKLIEDYASDELKDYLDKKFQLTLPDNVSDFLQIELVGEGKVRLFGKTELYKDYLGDTELKGFAAGYDNLSYWIFPIESLDALKEKMATFPNPIGVIKADIVADVANAKEEVSQEEGVLKNAFKHTKPLEIDERYATSASKLIQVVRGIYGDSEHKRSTLFGPIIDKRRQLEVITLMAVEAMVIDPRIGAYKGDEEFDVKFTPIAVDETKTIGELIGGDSVSFDIYFGDEATSKISVDAKWFAGLAATQSVVDVVNDRMAGLARAHRAFFNELRARMESSGNDNEKAEKYDSIIEIADGNLLDGKKADLIKSLIEKKSTFKVVTSNGSVRVNAEAGYLDRSVNAPNGGYYNDTQTQFSMSRIISILNNEYLKAVSNIIVENIVEFAKKDGLYPEMLGKTFINTLLISKSSEVRDIVRDFINEDASTQIYNEVNYLIRDIESASTAVVAGSSKINRSYYKKIGKDEMAAIIAILTESAKVEGFDKRAADIQNLFEDAEHRKAFIQSGMSDDLDRMLQKLKNEIEVASSLITRVAGDISTTITVKEDYEHRAEIGVQFGAIAKLASDYNKFANISVTRLVEVSDAGITEIRLKPVDPSNPVVNFKYEYDGEPSIIHFEYDSGRIIGIDFNESKFIVGSESLAAKDIDEVDLHDIRYELKAVPDIAMKGGYLFESDYIDGQYHVIGGNFHNAENALPTNTVTVENEGNFIQWVDIRENKGIDYAAEYLAEKLSSVKVGDKLETHDGESVVIQGLAGLNAIAVSDGKGGLVYASYKNLFGNDVFKKVIVSPQWNVAYNRAEAAPLLLNELNIGDYDGLYHIQTEAPALYKFIADQIAGYGIEDVYFQSSTFTEMLPLLSDSIGGLVRIADEYGSVTACIAEEKAMGREKKLDEIATHTKHLYIMLAMMGYEDAFKIEGELNGGLTRAQILTETVRLHIDEVYAFNNEREIKLYSGESDVPLKSVYVDADGDYIQESDITDFSKVVKFSIDNAVLGSILSADGRLILNHQEMERIFPLDKRKETLVEWRSENSVTRPSVVHKGRAPATKDNVQGALADRGWLAVKETGWPMINDGKTANIDPVAEGDSTVRGVRISGPHISMQSVVSAPTAQDTATSVEAVIESHDQQLASEVEVERVVDFGMDDAPATNSAKYNDNIKAIKLLKTLEATYATPTKEQREILSKYSGWGGLPQAFVRPNGEYARGWEIPAKELERLLTPNEMKGARESILSAYFTPKEVTDFMYKGLQKLGVAGQARWLEPSVGVGNYITNMPAELRSEAKIIGIELDSLTGRIAKAVHGDKSTKIYAERGFEEYVTAEGSFDVVVGNPPYGNYRVFDKNLPHLSATIHNFFALKSMHALRAGGIQAFVTSSYFMDAENPSVREMVARDAKLVGAVRLPKEVFKSEGASVVTDIIFLQKREIALGAKESLEQEGWVYTKPVEADGLGGFSEADNRKFDFKINEYFLKNKEMMVGDVDVAINQYGKKSLELTSSESIEPKLSELLEKLPSGLYQPEATVLTKLGDFEFTDDQALSIPIPEYVSVGMMFNHDGKTYRRTPDSNYGKNMQVVQDIRTKDRGNARLNEKELRVLHDIIDLRETLQKLVHAEKTTDGGDQAPEDLRKELNRKYDLFVKKNGFLNNRKNKRLYRSDAAYSMISAMEKYTPPISSAKSTNGKAVAERAEKAAIFSKRLLIRSERVMTAKTAQDALALSLSEKGGIDMDYMVSLLPNYSAERFLDELGDDIFLNPASKEYEWGSLYLSGNVRQKLREAETAARYDDAFIRNVDALVKIQPEIIPYEQISITMGAHWLPKSVLIDFVRHIAKDDNLDVEAVFIRNTGVWAIDAKENAELRTNWTSDGVTFARIIESAVTNSAIRVTTNINNTAVTDAPRTSMANNMVGRVRAEFAAWVGESVERRSLLEKTYNELINTNRRFDGVAPIGYKPQGMVGEEIYKPRGHQTNFAFLNIVRDANAAIHFTGAGKTDSCIIGANERMRVGKAKRTMIVAPNRIIGDWGRAIYKLYPDAKVLYPEADDFTKENREEMFARIVTGDYDYVLIGHSQLQKLPIDFDIMQKHISEELDQLRETLHEASNNSVIRDIEKRIKNTEAKLERLHFDKDAFAGVTLSQLGIDNIIVDESQDLLRRLPFVTKLQVAGLGSPQGAKKAANALVHLDYIRSLGGGVVTATATPLANSISDMYSWLRANNPQSLKDRDIHSFDTFINLFAEVSVEMELAIKGDSYRMVNRLRKFKNVPELLDMYLEVADTVSPAEVKASLEADGKKWFAPKLNEKIIVLEQTPEQAMQFDLINQELDAIDAGDSERNKLELITLATKVAMHPRMGDPDCEELYVGKLAKTVELVNDAIKTTTERVGEHGLHIVYIDMGVARDASEKQQAEVQRLFALMDDADQEVADSAREELYEKYSQEEVEDILAVDRFPFQNMLRDYLVQSGIPADKVASMNDVKTDAELAELYRRCNDGEVAVLLTSTQKGGVGMNVSKRAAGATMLSVPWRPDIVTQCKGRVERQGNMFYEADNSFEVYFNIVVTESSVEAWRASVVDSKAQALTAFTYGAITAREMEDIGVVVEDYAKVAAAASGSDLVKRIYKAKVALKEVEQEIVAQRNRVFNYTQRMRELETSIPQLEKMKENIKSFKLATEPYMGQEVKVTVIRDADDENGKKGTKATYTRKALVTTFPDGTQTSDPIAVETAILTRLLKTREPKEDVYLGNVNGVDLFAEIFEKRLFDTSKARKAMGYEITFKAGGYEFSREWDVLGYSAKSGSFIRTSIANADSRLKDVSDSLESRLRELESLKKATPPVFDESLVEKRNDLESMIVELEQEENDFKSQPATPEAIANAFGFMKDQFGKLVGRNPLFDEIYESFEEKFNQYTERNAPESENPVSVSDLSALKRDMTLTLREAKIDLGLSKRQQMLNSMAEARTINVHLGIGSNMGELVVEALNPVTIEGGATTVEVSAEAADIEKISKAEARAMMLNMMEEEVKAKGFESFAAYMEACNNAGIIDEKSLVVIAAKKLQSDYTDRLEFIESLHKASGEIEANKSMLNGTHLHQSKAQALFNECLDKLAGELEGANVLQLVVDAKDAEPELYKQVTGVAQAITDSVGKPLEKAAFDKQLAEVTSSIEESDTYKKEMAVAKQKKQERIQSVDRGDTLSLF